VQNFRSASFCSRTPESFIKACVSVLGELYHPDEAIEILSDGIEAQVTALSNPLQRAIGLYGRRGMSRADRARSRAEEAAFSLDGVTPVYMDGSSLGSLFWFDGPIAFLARSEEGRGFYVEMVDETDDGVVYIISEIRPELLMRHSREPQSISGKWSLKGRMHRRAILEATRSMQGVLGAGSKNGFMACTPISNEEAWSAIAPLSR